MYTSPEATSNATYSKAGWKAMATEAGSVQGVVVQIIVHTARLASSGASAAASLNSR